MSDTQTRDPTDDSSPLFYKHPEELSAAVHGAWRLKMGAAGFAAHTQFVPVVASEFIEAGHKYPLLFGANQNLPVALLGLLPHTNRYVKGENWQADAYVPAYVRRYPFYLAPKPDSSRIVLMIDSEAPQLVKSGDEGQPLFVDGKPTALIQQAWQFCETFSREFVATEAFVKLLAEHDLLVQRVVEISRHDHPPTALTGFSVVNGDALTALPDATLADWHRRGILALIYAHLGSLSRIPALAAA